MNRRETIILVHGTFAQSEMKAPFRTQWWEPNSKFCRGLDERLSRLGSPARCWSHVADKNTYEQDVLWVSKLFSSTKPSGEEGERLPVYDWKGGEQLDSAIRCRL
jgi:hypothetical protein